MTAYTLTRSHRKTLAIHIKPDGAVEVRAPLRLAKSEIERFLTLKANWIETKQAQIAATQPAELRQIPQSPYTKGEFEQVVLELVKKWEQRLGVTVSFVGLRDMTSRWGWSDASRPARPSVQGSCTVKTRRIRLNAVLAYCPHECLEYVVAHELVHLRENNHSLQFWAIVAEVMPDYKERQKKLKALSWLLNANGKD